jgi:hypothetical protein
MGRALSDSIAFPATADMREEGAMFKGQLVSKRMQDFGNGDKPVYKFKALDATCHFRRGKLDVEAPSEGDEVEVIPSTRLATQLAQATNGKIYTIIRLADGKKNRFGKCPKIFSVEEE